MTTLNGSQVRKRILETRDGCDKKCDTCVLSLKDGCVYDWLNAWQEWNKQRRIDFQKVVSLRDEG